MSSSVMSEVNLNARKILEAHPEIEVVDAVIMSCVEKFVKMFDTFIEDTLRLKEADGEIYKVEVSIHEFVEKRTPMLLLIVDIGLAIVQRYPNIARNFFTDIVEQFKIKIKTLELSGRIKDIYDLQSDFHFFKKLVEGGIFSNQLENALGSFEGVAPDYQKLYMSGLKSLGKKKSGRIAFDLLVSNGRGMPMHLKQLAKESDRSESILRKGLAELVETAPHLIRIVQVGNKDCYYIPDGIRRLHFK